jgi:hypothetical protein
MDNKQLQDDIKYIQEDLICEQPNGKYIKFSKIGNFITLLNEPKQKYINYWVSQYEKKSKEELKIILDVLNEKFSSGLISIEKMIELINTSKFEPERAEALKLLKTNKKEKRK